MRRIYVLVSSLQHAKSRILERLQCGRHAKSNVVMQHETNRQQLSPAVILHSIIAQWIEAIPE